MTFEEWYGSLLPFERKCLTREEAFQAGAASRDAEIARLKREDSRVKRVQNNSLKLANKVLSTKLAVEQAKNLGLLDFIARAQVSSGVCCCGEPTDGHSSPMSCGHSPVDTWDHAVGKLLDTPSDTSALKAIVKKAGEVMREKCLEEFSKGWIHADSVENEIHTLPGVTLEDLK